MLSVGRASSATAPYSPLSSSVVPPPTPPPVSPSSRTYHVPHAAPPNSTAYTSPPSYTPHNETAPLSPPSPHTPHTSLLDEPDTSLPISLHPSTLSRLGCGIRHDTLGRSQQKNSIVCAWSRFLGICCVGSSCIVGIGSSIMC